MLLRMEVPKVEMVVLRIPFPVFSRQEMQAELKKTSVQFMYE